MPEVKNDMWDAEWELELPSLGGRILAKDGRGSIVYEPNCSPYNESERKLSRLFLKSREMLELLKRSESVLKNNGYNSLSAEIRVLIGDIEGN